MLQEHGVGGSNPLYPTIEDNSNKYSIF